MSGLKSGFRQRIFRAVHAEAIKRKLDHDGLHDLCKSRYSVHSMSELTDGQLLGIYHEWTGKTLKRRVKLPAAGSAEKQVVEQMVSGEDLILLDQEFAKRNWGQETRGKFIARQLRGRQVIRSYGDFARVLGGVRAMNKRDGI